MEEEGNIKKKKSRNQFEIREMATNGRKGSFELGRKAVKELRRKKLWR